MRFSTRTTRTPQLVDLLRHHHDWAVSVTPPGHVQALDPDSTPAPGALWLTADDGDELAAMCALVPVDGGLVELKAMHVRSPYRGKGLGRRLLDHAITEARRHGFVTVVLETGTYDAFAPARNLYRGRGFTDRPPFGDYMATPVSVCMELHLDRPTP